MTGFLLRRLLQMAVLLAAVSFAVYCMIGLMPGDPVDLMAAGDPHMTPEGLLRLRELYGLDRPLSERYGRWLLSALSGDLGYSRLYGVPVLEALGPRLLNTLCLMGIALLVTVVLAVPLGVLAARAPHGWRDRVIGVFTLAGLSAPAFWVALLLMALFAVKLGWLPASADAGKPSSWILPVATIALTGLAVYARHMRASMINALAAPHIRTARAKGCGPARVVWRHAFRNALPPVLAVLMLDLGALFGGAVTVETVFAFPGMGRLLLDAVMGNDYNLALSGFLLLSAAVFLANFLADVLHALLDPRVALRNGA